MEWVLWTVGYVVMACITGRWGYNVTLNEYYTKHLNESKQLFRDFEANKAKYAEGALKNAKRDMLIRDSVPAICFGACWWPIYFTYLVIWSLIKSRPAIKVMQSKAEKEVAALRTQKALSDARKTEWKNALQTMEDAGIDTTELRNFEID